MSFRRSIRVGLVAAAALTGTVTAAPTAGGWTIEDWGPLFYRLGTPSGSVVRAVGPLFERRGAASGAGGWAARPFTAREEDPAVGRVAGDLLWPLGEFSALPPESDWRFLTVWYRCFDTASPRPRWRLWVLPLYVQGRGASGRSYLGCFPLGGRVEEFLGMDEVHFVLWPLWARSWDGGQTTTDVLFPFWSRSEGPNERRWRLFPLYGEAVRFGQYEKRFVLWPFWTSARYKYPGSSGSGWILFPLYGRLDLSDQTSRMWLPPLIRVSKGDRLRMVHAPWPFIRYQTGQHSALHVWPLFGRTTDPRIDRSYILWPVVWRLRATRGGQVSRSYWILPFVHLKTTRTREPKDSARAAERTIAWKVWPLAAGECRDGECRWRAPDLWPGPDLPPVERSWAPLWALISHRSGPGSSATELLWGLVRRRREPDGLHWSLFPLFERQTGAPAGGEGRGRFRLLKGLLGVEWGAGSTRIRLLYGLTLDLGGRAPSSCTNQTISSRR